MSNAGLVAIKLGKDYGEQKAGETHYYSPGRAAWLRENGHEADHEREVAAKPKRPKARPEREPEQATEEAPELVQGDING